LKTMKIQIETTEQNRNSMLAGLAMLKTMQSVRAFVDSYLGFDVVVFRSLIISRNNPSD
jgi:hypothetical protein